MIEANEMRLASVSDIEKVRERITFLYREDRHGVGRYVAQGMEECLQMLDLNEKTP